MKDRAAYQAAGASQQTVESSGAPHLTPVSADTEKARAKKASPSGLTFPRFFTEAGIDPFDEVEWELRAAVIGNERGEVVFEQRDVEIPRFWSQQATNIVVSKYFRGQIGTPARERSVRQLIGRVVDTIAGWGTRQHYFASDADAATSCSSSAMSRFPHRGRNRPPTSSSRSTSADRSARPSANTACGS